MFFCLTIQNYTIKRTLRIYVKLEKFQSTVKWTIMQLCVRNWFQFYSIIRKVYTFVKYFEREKSVNNIPEPVHIMLHNQRTSKFSIKDIVSCLVWLEVFKQCLKPCYLNACINKKCDRILENQISWCIWHITYLVRKSSH